MGESVQKITMDKKGYKYTSEETKNKRVFVVGDNFQMARPYNLEGYKFNRLTVISKNRSITNSNKSVFWNCICDCGNIASVTTNCLCMGIKKTGGSKSCGCYSWESSVINATKHNFCRTDEYKIYHGIKKRCYNKNSSRYKYYGEKGITMSEEWLNSFEQFYKDMGDRPSKKHEVDRINNLLGYSKENCKWSTRTEQVRNTSRNVTFEYKGKKLCVSEWCEVIGFKDYRKALSYCKQGRFLEIFKSVGYE